MTGQGEDNICIIMVFMRRELNGLHLSQIVHNDAVSFMAMSVPRTNGKADIRLSHKCYHFTMGHTP